MLDILKRAWIAATSFYQIKTNLLFPSTFSGVDVVIYDKRVSLDDALMFAMEKDMPLFQMSPPTLFKEIEVEEGLFEGELIGRLSYKEVTVAKSGDWWSEWQNSSACALANPETVTEQMMPFYFFRSFSIEEGPLAWEDVSPLLNVNEEKDLKLTTKGSLYVEPDQKVVQAWSQAKIRWFDAQYRNCTLKLGADEKPECAQSSRLYHGDAPYKVSPGTFHLSRSYGPEHCQC